MYTLSDKRTVTTRGQRVKAEVLNPDSFDLSKGASIAEATPESCPEAARRLKADIQYAQNYRGTLLLGVDEG